MQRIASLGLVLLSALAFGPAACTVEQEALPDVDLDEAAVGVDEQAATSTTPRTKACCNKTDSGGLTGCDKPYYPPGGGATCVGDKVAATCDANYDNCREGGWTPASAPQ